MKNKIPLFTLIFFFILGNVAKWSILLKFIVILNAVLVLYLVAAEFWRLIKNG